MATGREYLQSIMESCAALQDQDDAILDSISDGLKRVDDELDEALEYFGIDRRA